MQAITDAELEAWHDYEVESPREIVALLRQIAEKNQLIRMLIKGEADVCVTSLLAVDPDAGTVVIDCSVSPEQNTRIVAAGTVRCDTSLDKIRIVFGLDNLREVQFEGGTALSAAIPANLIRLQRREFYRMPTPVTNPVRATIPLPAELGGGTAVFPLADISCGGVAIHDSKLQLGTTIGDTFPNCRIDLPEIGPVTCSLQVRNSIDMTLLNNKTSRRLGCQFVDISRGNLAAVQRYITKLERERNARLAGLA
ncbi:flagellar brake protein [Massilia sp. Root133]|uniref:flagellar brake protein n=1 Tax=unclassified Massilia TaxID=2609279 RepID=UPI00070009BA|nr:MULTISPECIES: flagellar brake protein [unclassified Massilia]KQX96742.1 flagellar brake protein [Massilia sp. Root133]KQZ52453.1 flagellar brake protein [Massilia sp. Root1485]